MRGRVREASNAVLYCTVSYEGREAACVYKPVAGERPLWDFPDGTLAQREVAAYEVSEATGWGLVPPTVLRDGPYGEGMCQLWIEASTPGSELLALVEGEEPGPGWKAVGFAEVGEGRTALLVHADDERLRRLAVLDAVINNADRKGGHLLPAAEGRLYGIDHGVTFNVENKLRTLLWGWAGEPLHRRGRRGARRACADGAGTGGPLATRLARADHSGRGGRHAGAGGRAADAPGGIRSRAGSGRRFPGRRSERTARRSLPQGGPSRRARSAAAPARAAERAAGPEPRDQRMPAAVARAPPGTGVRFVYGTSVRLGSWHACLARF